MKRVGQIIYFVKAYPINTRGKDKSIEQHFDSEDEAVSFANNFTFPNYLIEIYETYKTDFVRIT